MPMPRNKETHRHKDIEKQRHKTQIHTDTETTQRHTDTATQRYSDTKT